jgi:ribose 5-phosphate isomerase B
VDAKRLLKIQLYSKGRRVIDLGPYSAKTPVDYVDYAHQLAEIISAGDAGLGILVCGTGVGMSIVANRHNGVRAALVHNLETALLCREHNDSNVLCLGTWKNTAERNAEIVDAWLAAKFGEQRHNPRIAKIDPAPARRVVFANGCFDLITQGHITMLNFAGRLGDKLVVGLNSDESVRELKGEGRPVNTFEDRKRLLESLRAVDEVVACGTNTLDVILSVNPDVVVKGAEWGAEEVRRRDGIPENIKVVVCPLLPGVSTTAIITKIQQNKGDGD